MTWQLVGNLAGKDADNSAIDAMKAEISSLRAELASVKSRPSEDDITATIAAMVKQAVSEATANIDAEAIEQAVATHVARIPTPQNGKDADPVAIKALVTAAVADIPAPKDGQSITVDDVAPLIVSEVAKAMSAIVPAKDGIGLTGALIDRSGHLVVTLSDGTAKDVGLVVGQDADPTRIAELVKAAVDAIPRPRDGIDGKDGRDGLGFDDIHVEHDGERSFTIKFVRGELVKTFGFQVPMVIDRGVWRQESKYEKGDGVTWAGSYWIAKDVTNQKPGDGATAWRLAVKKGADGKPGPEGKEGKPGPRGDKGEDGRVYR